MDKCDIRIIFRDCNILPLMLWSAGYKPCSCTNCTCNTEWMVKSNLKGLLTYTMSELGI